ncbi:hypothetical protein AOLI_G00158980, partial [Acnodon oligacanthus]
CTVDGNTAAVHRRQYGSGGAAALTSGEEIRSRTKTTHRRERRTAKSAKSVEPTFKVLNLTSQWKLHAFVGSWVHTSPGAAERSCLQEDIAQFPYVEFTGRDSITCPTCKGSGRIPSGQVNELVALIPYSDQRLQPQRTKQYVGLSVIVCLLVSCLVAFFMFPRPVLVEDGGIRSVIVVFDQEKSRVLINMTSSLNFHNTNFFTVVVDSVYGQVLYMKTVIGTEQLDNIITIQPLSQKQMNFTVTMEISGSLSYVYAFCTMASIKVHNIVVFMQTSVKTSYMMRHAQNTLEAYRYIDCGANSTLHQHPLQTKGLLR